MFKVYRERMYTVRGIFMPILEKSISCPYSLTRSLYICTQDSHLSILDHSRHLFVKERRGMIFHSVSGDGGMGADSISALGLKHTQNLFFFSLNQMVGGGGKDIVNIYLNSCFMVIILEIK